MKEERIKWERDNPFWSYHVIFFSILLPQNSKQGCFPNKKEMFSKKSLKDFEMPNFGLQILTPSGWF